MKVLILGSGGREHAIAHALSKSKIVTKLHCAPGNPGIAKLARTHSEDPCDADAILKLCLKEKIDLVVIGPEAPLVTGVADTLRDSGLLVFGPGQEGATLESSKIFSKNFMQRHGIKTASFDCCYSVDDCEAALTKRKPPYVVKADGLAAGKGAFIVDDLQEAIDLCYSLIENDILGEAGRQLVIEDYLPGKELTILAITDGKTTQILPTSQDHKRALDNDQGENTGGMGAYSPVPWATEQLLKKIESEVLEPTIKGLEIEDIPFCGVIYAGLMLTEDGEIYLIEYNVRLGDPEAQVVLPIYPGDFGEAVLACCMGTLGETSIPPVSGCALGIVLASAGYPAIIEKGFPITGTDAGDNEKKLIFQAGTTYNNRGEVITNGGRVLTVVALGDDLKQAHESAYNMLQEIHFEKCHYRKDIGKEGITSCQQ